MTKPNHQQLIRQPGTQEHREYQERSRIQALHWAQGKVYHNKIDDECTPDFSCCEPDMFEKDEDKRWALYHEQYGNKH